MLALSGIILLGIVVVGVALTGGMFYGFLKKGQQDPHPSELSSQSRSAVRPLREAADELEKLVEQNKGNPEVGVIGRQAVEASRKLVSEAMKWAEARDSLADLARREGVDSEPGKIVAKIDAKILEATRSIESMQSKIAGRLVKEVSLPDEGSLDELVSRLENLSQSMDEVDQELYLRNQ